MFNFAISIYISKDYAMYVKEYMGNRLMHSMKKDAAKCLDEPANFGRAAFLYNEISWNSSPIHLAVEHTEERVSVSWAWWLNEVTLRCFVDYITSARSVNLTGFDAGN